VDLRNRGKRIFAFLSTDPIPVHEFSVDGRRYRLMSPSVVQGGHVQPLAPGVEFSNLPANLPGQVHLAPGRHTVYISFQLEGIEVVSNPVGIEILNSR